MDKTELVRRLYEEDSDPADFLSELDEEARAEWAALKRAKDALDELPRRGPSQQTLEAIHEAARSSVSETGGGFLRLVAGSNMSRFAAAAVVILGLGVGYWVISTQVTPLDTTDQITQTESDEAFRSELEDADGQTGASQDRSGSRRSAAAPEPSDEPSSEAAGEDRLFRFDADAEISVESEAPADLAAREQAASGGGEFPSLSDRAPFDDTTLWNTETEFRTFFWQMEGLAERSPDDEWEAAVPLEGSFERLEAQDRLDPRIYEAGARQR